jgi:hypothetical protein
MTATPSRPRTAAPPARTAPAAAPAVTFTAEQFLEVLRHAQDKALHESAPPVAAPPAAPEKPLHEMSSRELSVALAETYGGCFDRPRRFAA